MNSVAIFDLIGRQGFVIFEHSSGVDQPLAFGWRVCILAGRQFSFQVRNRSRFRQRQGIFRVVGGLHIECDGGGLCRRSLVGHDITDATERGNLERQKRWDAAQFWEGCPTCRPMKGVESERRKSEPGSVAEG